MDNNNKKRSRYRRPEKETLKPLRLSDKHYEVLSLFAPGNFDRITAEIAAVHINRSLPRAQHILAELFEHGLVNRIYRPQNPLEGGSKKVISAISRKGASLISDVYDNIRVDDIDPYGFYPFLEHRVLANRFNTMLVGACGKTAGVGIAYRFNDGEFKHPVKIDGKVENIVPDTVIGLTRQDNRMRNFFLEVQRSSRRTKDLLDQSEAELRTIRLKLKKYYHFFKHQEWDYFPYEKYPRMENLKNMRVLVLTDVSEVEHQNLIRLARSIDEHKKGLRLFYFLRASDLDLANPEKIFDRVWQTPVEGDDLKSILK